MDIKIVRDDPVYYGHLLIGEYKLVVFREYSKVPYKWNHPFPYLFTVGTPDNAEEQHAVCDFIEKNKERIKNEFGLVFEFYRDGTAWTKKYCPKESEIFGIDNYVSRQDVLTKYRELSLQYHPDRLPNATEEEKKAAEEKFKEITAAYNALKEIDYENYVKTVYVTDLHQKRLYELYESSLVEEKNNRIASLVW